MVAEVLQNSNITYRIYDYGRVDTDGRQRELHVEKALDVVRYAPPLKYNFDGHLAQYEYFTVDVVSWAFTGAADETSSVSLLIVDGKGTLSCGGKAVVICKGDSFFLPAGSGKFRLEGQV